MQLKIDSDVAAVALFMQTTLPAAKLVSVAQAVHDLAPLLWQHYRKERVNAPELSISPDLVACKPANAKE